MLTRLTLRVFLLVCLGPLAAAQLDLPSRPVSKPKPARAAAERPAQSGDETIEPGPSASKKRGGSDGVALPDRLSSGADAVPATEADRGVGLAFDELRGVKSLDSGRIAKALARVRLAGAAGVEEARVRLASDRPAVFTLALQVLLEAGDPADRARVAERLRERVPVRAGSTALRALLAADPVLAGPEYLAELLDHPQAALRNAAAEELAERMDAGTLALLAKALDSRRSESRLLALDLVATLEDSSVIHVVVDRLADPNAKVANRAARLLASSPDERVVRELKTLGLRDVSLEVANEVRRSAYALLALVEREDTFGTRLLTEEHVPGLLVALRSPHPAYSGAAAIALAGIGFASEDVTGTRWLDLEVPQALVRLVSGATFHSDFTSLTYPAVRRLTLISGEKFGEDGPAWQSWWVRSASTFHARRAAMRVEPADITAIEVQVAAPGLGRFQLLGSSSLAVSDDAGTGGETFYLTDEESTELVGMLRREGVFGVDRVPGSRAAGPEAQRLTVRVAGQEKTFELGGAASEPWFRRALAFAAGLRDRNLWQRYPDRRVHATRYEHWAAGREAWSAPEDREERLKQQIFAHLSSVPSDLRDVGLAELERLFVEAGMARAADLDPLLELLGSERFLGPRARRWIDLCAWAASAEGDPLSSEAGAVATDPLTEGTAAAAPRRQLRPADGARLAEVLIETFGGSCASELAWVLAASGDAAILRAAQDPRPFMRAVSATALAQSEDPECRFALQGLFDDPSPDVVAAAVYVAGEARLEEFRNAILQRATEGEPVVRAAALRGAARLGGGGVKELLVQAAVDSHPELRRAAIEGLAELGDPSTAPYLVSIFSRGPSDDFYATARAGLVRMGERAWRELLRLVHSDVPELRRDAALLLAEQGVPQVASTLIGILTEFPEDSRTAEELAVLTCVDHRERPDPSKAWWEWWDLVVHDDSNAWFRAALERVGVGAPAAEVFQAGGDRAAALQMVELLERPEDFLAERARRELQGMVGEPLGSAPVTPAQRVEWLESVRDRIDERFPE